MAETTSSVSPPSVFPWSDGQGISRVLDDPALWAFILSEDRVEGSIHARRHIKRVAKRLWHSPAPLVIVIDHDENFGAAFANLMRLPHGRDEALREIEDRLSLENARAWIGQSIHAFARDVAELPKRKQIREKKGGYWHIVPDKLARWLKSQSDLSDDKIQAWGLMACSLSLEQPELSGEIYGAMVTGADAFRRQFEAAQATKKRKRRPRHPGLPARDQKAKHPPAATVRTGTRGKGSKTPSEAPVRRSDAEAQPPSSARVGHNTAAKAEGANSTSSQSLTPVSSPTHSHDLSEKEQRLIELLSSDDYWARTATIATLQEVRSLLREEYTALEHEFTSLAGLEKDVQDRLGRLSRCSELDLAFNTSGPLPDSRKNTLSVARKVLTDIVATCGRVETAVQALGELASRLGRSPGRHRFEQGPLTLVAETLEAAADALRQEMKALAQRDARVGDFLQSFSDADQDVRAGLLDLQTCRDLAHAIFGRRLGTADDKAADTWPQRTLARLRGQYELVGILVCHLWKTRPDIACELADHAIEAAQGDRAKEIAALSYLSHSQLHRFAEAREQWVGLVREYLLATAIVTNQADKLAWIRPLMFIGPNQSPCWAVYEHLVRAEEREEISDLGLLLRLSVQEDPTKPYRSELIELIDRPAPGSHGSLFFELREEARERFLCPLKPQVQSGEAARAFADWQAYGELDDMIERCEQAVDDKRVTTRHRDKTRKYLEDFQGLLVRWRDAALQPAAVHSDELRMCLDNLKDGATPATPECRRMVELLTHAPAEKGVVWPPADFGQRCSNDGRLRCTVDDGIVHPGMVNSWISAVRSQEVPIACYAADYLADLLADEPVVVDAELMEQYLTRGEVRAAQLAARGDETLLALIQSRIDKIRAEFLEEHEILEEAKSYRRDNPEIDQSLSELHGCLDRGALSEAEEWLDLLQTAVIQHRCVVDPESQTLITLLGEARVEEIDRSSKEALRRQFAAVRKAAGYRLMHLETMHEVVPALPENIRQAWTDTAARLDPPSRWPRTPEDAFDAAALIEYFGKYLEKQWQRRSREPLLVEHLVAEVSEWFLRQLEDEFTKPDRLEFTVLEAVQKGIREEYWGPQDVLEHIGATSVPPPVSAVDVATVAPPPVHTTDVPPSDESDAVDVPPAPDVPRTDGREADTARGGLFLEIVSDVRRRLVASMGGEPRISDASDDKLRAACRERRWDDVRVLAANHESHVDPPQGKLTSEECIYGIALSLTVKAGDPAFSQWTSDGALAAILEKLDRELYYLDEDTLRYVVLLCFARTFEPAVTTSTVSDELRDTLHAFLRQIVHARPKDRRRRWFSYLLSTTKRFTSQGGKPIRGDVWLVRWLWEFLTGHRDVAAARADLLSILYKFGHLDLLKDLAEQHADSARIHISQCLDAFSQAESNPGAVGEAHNLARIVIEHSKRVKTIKPWIILVNKLDVAPKEFEDEVPCRVEVEQITREDDHFVIGISLIPSRYNWPQHLEVQIGADTDLSDRVGPRFDLLPEGTLTSQRLETIQVPAAFVASEEGFVRVPYRITGRSTQEKEITLKGAWTWADNESMKPNPFSFDEMRRLWPGAEGLEVKTRKDHHGRQQELRRIEYALRADDHRQRSLLIIGQRRIGKTSLLNQVLIAHPPREGHICAAYVSVGKMIRSDDRSLSEALFKNIVRLLEDTPGEKNRALKQALAPTGKRKFDRLFSHLRPRESIAAALEGMVDVLDYHTNGVVKRLALCLDEFHNVFSWSDEEEINAVMWDLRTIVQQSSKVSLLFAGSGLTRRLVDRYEAALFGSIECIELKPFSWESERDAIADTFIPRAVRDQMAPSAGFDVLLEHAYRLSQAYPWYLSMLGSATAAVFGRRPVTPAMLLHVSDEMVAGRVRRDDLTFTAEKFYGHLIESLNIMGNRKQAIAQLCLLEVARQGSADWPWVAAPRIHQHELLADRTEHAERSSALKALERESVIVKRTERKRPEYSVRVPLVAAAVKHDADRLEDDALTRLQ
jgi:hypothetical protein